MQYRAFIVLPGGHEDPLAEQAMISVVRDGPTSGRSILRMTPKGWLWEHVPEAERIDPTLELPGEALAAIVEAVHRLDGYRPGAEQVLREWLKAEQGRVQTILDLLVPKVIDAGSHPLWITRDMIGSTVPPRGPSDRGPDAQKAGG